VTRIFRQAEQARTEVAERVGEQPGDLHLGDAELVANLCLRHLPVKTHHQDPPLTLGQFAPVRRDGLDAEHVFHPRVLFAEKVGQASQLRLAGQRRVQRARLETHLRPPGIPQIITANPQVPGQVGLGRHPAQVLGQLPGCRTEVHHQLLD
jgi:hypothetical protein